MDLSNDPILWTAIFLTALIIVLLIFYVYIWITDIRYQRKAELQYYEEKVRKKLSNVSEKSKQEK
jgi:uncharacterized membrane protein